VPTTQTTSSPAWLAPQRAAVIYNPIKVDLPALKRSVDAAAETAGWDAPLWLSTTALDAGQAAAATAIRRGVNLVFAAGGDGTVRAVAEGLRGNTVPLALIPAGTGNLLARNLHISLTNLDAAIATGFTGVDRPIDLGLTRIVRESGAVEEHVFVVMAGLGLDAKLISNTNPRLKKAVGWLAYVDAGLRSLPELSPLKLRYSLNHAPERVVHVHTIIMGNCGELPGGILLMPDAKPDDGVLDIAAFRPRGPLGWITIWNRVAWGNGVLRKSAIGRGLINLSTDVKDVTYLTGKDLRLWVEKPEEFQLDGDQFGEAVSVHTWLEPHGLIVRVPRH
jgi:diacylglycerol kinase (ATP)